MTLLLFLLASSGLMVGVVMLHINQWLPALVERWWRIGGELLRCPGCFGFWSGVIVSVLGLSPVEGWLEPYWASTIASRIVAHALDGLIAVGPAVLYHALVTVLALKTEELQARLAPYRAAQAMARAQAGAQSGASPDP